MIGQTKTKALRENAGSASELTAALAKDKKFRKELLSAIGHGATAQRRAARRIGFAAAVGKLSADPKLRREVREMTTSLQKAWSRIEKKRSHRKRNLLLLGGAGGIAVAAAARTRGGTGRRVIEESIDVEVPVATAYNQWTQFEEFPRFMEGVKSVRQLDDTHLEWTAEIAGEEHRWRAEIVRQEPDRLVAWRAEQGKYNSGTVTFEPLAASRTRINVEIVYDSEGWKESFASTVGLDARRVRGDLERFKEFIESRGTETGAWRGEVEQGMVTHR